MDLHCTFRIRRWLDEDLHEISHWYYRATAGCTTLLLLARNSFWNVEPLDARRTHAYDGISTTPNSEVQLQKQKGKCKCKVLIPPFPGFGTKSARSVDYHTPPRSKGPPPSESCFSFTERRKKTHMQFPRNMAISKSRSEALSSPNGTICGGHLARCKRGCCSLK